MRGGLNAADPVLALGFPDPGPATRLTTLLDEAADADLPRLLGLARMNLVTDRRSPEA